MADDLPRGPDGLQGCEWCGEPIRQPATGRRRRYCKPGHREMAYRARARRDAINEALKAAGVDLPGNPTFPAQASAAPRQPPAPAGEECPYCRELTKPGTGLLAHLQVCPDGPGFIS
jgi:hypothetical protein